MDTTTELKTRIRQLLVDNLLLQIEPSTIRDDQPLFGADGLGLDSVDALQLVVALDKHYGLKVPDPESARQILQSINSITAAIQACSPPPP
jgi:acyl carrier protein